MTTISESLQKQSLHHRRSLGRVITTPDVFCVTAEAITFSGGVGGTYNAWGRSMPAAQVTNTYAYIPMPALWAGQITRIYALWMPQDNTIGTVQLIGRLRRMADGSVMNLTHLGTITDITPGSITFAAISEIELSALADDIAQNEFVRLEFVREGTAAADGYAANIYLMGIGWRLSDGA